MSRISSESKHLLHARKPLPAESSPEEPAAGHRAAGRSAGARQGCFRQCGRHRRASAGVRARTGPLPPAVRVRRWHRTTTPQARRPPVQIESNRRRSRPRVPRWGASRRAASDCTRRAGSPWPPIAGGAERGPSRSSCGTPWRNGCPTRRGHRRRAERRCHKSSRGFPGPAQTGFQGWHGSWAEPLDLLSGVGRGEVLGALPIVQLAAHEGGADRFGSATLATITGLNL